MRQKSTSGFILQTQFIFKTLISFGDWSSGYGGDPCSRGRELDS